MTPASAQAEWARSLICALVDCGVRDVVVSPGSRSTPFVLAAAARQDLRLTTIVDERSAAFYALGQAKTRGTPTALLCTSGTAGAHYYPAIIEANYAHAPLIAITADRPSELMDCGAPQTIDQQHLFGTHVRWFADVGVAEDSDDARRALVRKVVQAVSASLAPTPGPVHITAPARKPLEPEALPTPHADSVAHPRVFAPEAQPSAAAIAHLVAACAEARRGLIVAGPAPVAARETRSAVAAFAKATGFPVLAETTSQLRHGGDVPVIDAFDALVRSPAFAETMAPDLVVQLGSSPVSSGWRDYLARHRNCARVVIAEHGWHDPHNSATALIRADVAATLTRAAEQLAPGETTEWATTFARTNDIAWRWVPSDEPLSEATVARATLDALPAGARLVLSNSNPVRAIDSFAPARTRDLAVVSQRGASGIDGLISGAAGVASVGGEPTALLIGDVAFGHDLGGLAVASRATAPLVIVVVDNGGGRIFEQLPIARLPGVGAVLREHWLTPSAVAVDAIAGAFGIAYARATEPRALTDAITGALAHAGCTLVHAIVPGDAVTNTYRRMWSDVDAAIRAQLGSRAGGS